MILRKDGKLMRRAGKLIYREPDECWQGTMTVGLFIVDFPEYRGWDSVEGGSITNKPVLNCEAETVLRIMWEQTQGTLEVSGSGTEGRVGDIEIDGEVYSMNGNPTISGLSNPFPSVGQTCLIRILT